MGREKSGFDVNGFMGALSRLADRHEVAKVVVIDPFSRALMDDDPQAAIGRIREVYDKGLDFAYTDEGGANTRSFVEAVAGGPYERVPAALYNAVGFAYPYFSRELKNEALWRLLSVFDVLNYDVVATSHTPYIREPLLLSDISIIRPYYFPGTEEGKEIIKGYDTFSALRQDLMDDSGLFRQDKVISDFLVAMALMWSSCYDSDDKLTFREDCVRAAEPQFLDRTLKGIVGYMVADAEKSNLAERVDKLRSMLPVTVHNRIEPIMEEADWPDYKEFRI